MQMGWVGSYSRRTVLTDVPTQRDGGPSSAHTCTLRLLNKHIHPYPPGYHSRHDTKKTTPQHKIHAHGCRDFPSWESSKASWGALKGLEQFVTCCMRQLSKAILKCVRANRRFGVAHSKRLSRKEIQVPKKRGSGLVSGYRLYYNTPERLYRHQIPDSADHVLV